MTMLEQPPAKIELTFTEPLPTMAYGELERGVQMFPDAVHTALAKWKPEVRKEAPKFCNWRERK